jgi:hypothetical protein
MEFPAFEKIGGQSSQKREASSEERYSHLPCAAAASWWDSWLRFLRQTTYDIRTFFHPATACTPSIIELPWTEAADHLVVTPLGRRLIEHRSLFLSRKARLTFTIAADPGRPNSSGK